MSDYFKKIKNWYEEFRIRKPSYDQKGIKPANDWILLLLSTQIIILLSALGAFYLYSQVNAGTIFIVEDDSKVNEIKINSTLLEKIVNDINQRGKTTLETRQNKSNPPDPSM